MTQAKRYATLLVFLHILAHALVLLSLLAFGLRAGGWVLYPVAVAWYGLFVSVFLLLAGRAAERRQGVWTRRLWRWATLAGLLALLVWTGRATWMYGRVLLSPLPAWADRWQYAPLPRVPLSALGLSLIHI